MEVNKKVYLDWFKSDNESIAQKAMRKQLGAVLAEKGSQSGVITEEEQKLSAVEKFFTFDELLAVDNSLAAQGMDVVVSYPRLFPVLLELVGEAEAEGKKIPVSVYAEIIGISAYHLYDPDLRRLGLEFISGLQLEGTDLYKEIVSLLRCVGSMSELKEPALAAVRRAEGVDFCVEIYGFLKQWGCLCDESCEILQEAFKYIIPQWAPLMIEALTTCPGKYRYRLSMALFREYFPTQGGAVLNKLLPCLSQEGNVELQKKLIDELFSFMEEQDKSDKMLEHIGVFLGGLSYWIRHHWEFVGSRILSLWRKYDKSPIFFGACRAAFVNDETLIAFQPHEVFSPFDLLTAEEAEKNPDCYLLLLKLLSWGDALGEDLSKCLLRKMSPAFEPKETVDVMVQKLDNLFKGGNRYLTIKYAGKFVDALIAGGGKVENVSRLADFVSANGLSVPVFDERYAAELKALSDKAAEEEEILAYLNS